MTLRRTLKRRIRSRQEKTGESYAAARAQVLAARPGPFPVIELEDVSPEAHKAGIVCAVRVTPALATTTSLPKILRQLHAILAGATEGLVPMQGVALRGEADKWAVIGTGHLAGFVGKLRAFTESLDQGLRGPGPSGRILAFDAEVDGRVRTVVAQLVPRFHRDPLLVLSVFRDVTAPTLLDSIALWARVPVLP